MPRTIFTTALLLLLLLLPSSAAAEGDCQWRPYATEEGVVQMGCFVEDAAEPLKVLPLEEALDLGLIPATPPEEVPATPLNPKDFMPDPSHIPLRPIDVPGLDLPDPPEILPPPAEKPLPGPLPSLPPVKKEPPKKVINPPLPQPSGADTPYRQDGPFSTVLFSRDLSLGDIRAIDFSPFLLPIYQACGTEYNVPWYVLASINKIETDFGRLAGQTSYAGAMGWMQFMPGTWDMYGTDANRDGRADPYNPVDAICSAARYLDASGYSDDVRGAIWSYNHADWYVEDVLRDAEVYRSIPTDFIAALSSLAAPSEMPLRGADVADKKIGKIPGSLLRSESDRRVRAVVDGKIESTGVSEQLGRYVLLRDALGNRFLYAGLADTELPLEEVQGEKKPKVEPVSDDLREERSLSARSEQEQGSEQKQGDRQPRGRERERGTVLAGDTIALAKEELFFALKPAGKQSPWIDPEVFMRGWGLLRQAAFKERSQPASLSQILMMPREALQDRVLRSENLDIYPCGRSDIASGVIDRRVLALLAYLAAEGYELGVSSLLCGRGSIYTASGNVSNHAHGGGVDIHSVQGVPVLGNQGPGGVVEDLVRRIMDMQGSMRPDELISLYQFGGPSWSDPVDHADHVHVGYSLRDPGSDVFVSQAIKPEDWQRVLQQIREIPTPKLVDKRPGR